MKNTTTIIRSVDADKTNFTPISNMILQNTDLSFEARGLLGYIVSLPHDWSLSKEQVRLSNNIGIDKFRRMWKELETAGYIISERKKTKEGKFYWDYKVSDKATINLKTTVGKTTDGLTTDGSSTYGLSTDGKPTDIQKNNKQKKQEQKNNKQKKQEQSANTEYYDFDDSEITLLNRTLDVILDFSKSKEHKKEAFNQWNKVIPDNYELSHLYQFIQQYKNTNQNIWINALHTFINSD